ncbi:MAG: hypothetical protein LBG18_07145 [Mediterranea sp.]|jgi:hypothetical protein|nr:hypothetical protein [Mediterranea sp.]
MVSIGDILLGEFFPEDGITPKNGEPSRKKMLIVLGQDTEGNYICGVVINSEIKNRNPESQYPLYPRLYTFLKHNSFVNCDNLLCVSIERACNFVKIGQIAIVDLGFIRKTVVASKVIKGKLKKKYGLFEIVE